MRKGLLPLLMVCASFTVTLLSCRNDEYLAAAPAPSDQSFVEQFDTMQNAYNRGWRWANRSVPLGPSMWMQAPGPGSGMAAYSSHGTNTGAAFTDALSTIGTNDGIISNWLISPSIIMKNGDKIIFYTKTQLDATVTPPKDYGARLQVCMNPMDDEISVGNGDDPGKFSTVFLEINGNEDENIIGSAPATAYPAQWTRFEATVYGLTSPIKSRFAFRYFLHNAGTTGAGLGIGIDSVAYVSAK